MILTPTRYQVQGHGAAKSGVDMLPFILSIVISMSSDACQEQFTDFMLASVLSAMIIKASLCLLLHLTNRLSCSRLQNVTGIS